MKILILSIIAILASPAQAAIQLVEQGRLMGAFDVDVGGSLFDVHFAGGNCISVFSGCGSSDDFTFGITTGLAATATRALLDQVLLDTEAGAFDSTPWLTWGIGDHMDAEILTPVDVVDTGGNPDKPDLKIMSAYNTSTGTDHVYANEYFCCKNLRQHDTGDGGRYVYAVWAPAASMLSSSVSAVPEPEIFAMLLTGLGIMGFATRRKL